MPQKSNKEQIKIYGPPLSRKQLEIYDAIVGSKKKFHIINASRQAGKTFLLIQLLFNYCFNYKNINLLVVSPNHSQNLLIFDKIIRMVEKNLIYKQNRFEKWIEFITGVKIFFKSADVYQNIRGSTYNFCFIDEFSWMRQSEIFSEAVRPTTSTFKDSKICVFSTPRGKNLFYELYQLGLEDKNYQSYKMLYTDNPLYDVQEVEDAKRNMPDKIFRTEYLAEFIDSGFVFTNVRECAVLKKNLEPEVCYAGVDIGKDSDYTAISLINNKYEVKTSMRINHKSYDTIISFIKENLIKFNVKKCYIETNFEKMVYESIKKELYNTVESFTTTHASKNYMIEKLILLFEQKKIKILDDKECPEMIRELEMYDCKYSKTSGSLIYNAAPGFHDDHVIALALAVQALEKFSPRENGLGISVINLFDQYGFSTTGNDIGR